MTRRTLPLLLLLAFTAACGSKSNPTAPSTPATPTVTKIIRLGGSMGFGNVTLGQSKTNIMQVYNDGNTAFSFSGMTVTSGLGAVLKAAPLSGTVQPGSRVDVTIEFTPTAVTTYSGNITVTAPDTTSGTNSIAFSGAGTLDGIAVFSKSGTGDTVFDIPSYVTRVRITGRYTANSSNFILRISGRLIVNELLGTAWGQTLYDGTLLTGGGTVVEITNSSGVQWTLTEVR